MYQVLLPPSARVITSQSVAVTASSTQASATFSAQTRMVRLQCNTMANYIITDTATAATSAHIYLPAHVVEYVKVNPGQTISAILVSSGGLDGTAPAAGTVWVTELTA